MSIQRVIACNAGYGGGGIGQHFAQLVEESRGSGELAGYVAAGIRAGDEQIARIVPRGRLIRTAHRLRLSYAKRAYHHLVGDQFDRDAARHLRRPFNTFMGFVGKSLHCFRRARSLGADRLELIAANSHVENVVELHRLSARVCGYDDTWLGPAQVRKTLREYETADLIYVHSDYTAQSFLDRGISADRLVRTVLETHPRFVPPAALPDDDTFRVAYAGRLDATKGIPLLLRAFERLPVRKKELRLVGGWSTRWMRRLIQEAVAADPRIRVAPGDPVEPFQLADVFVHPTFEDGFAYSPMEALAVGTPVVVTAETGMKEYVRPAENGYICPAGDVDALVDRMVEVYHRPLKRTEPLITKSAV